MKRFLKKARFTNETESDFWKDWPRPSRNAAFKKTENAYKFKVYFQ